MTAVRLRTLVRLAVVVGLVSWLLLRAWEQAGHAALPLPWTAVAGMLVLAAVVLAAGLDVRRYLAERSASPSGPGRPGSVRGRPFDPLRAARTAALAKAAAYTGAALSGWYAGLASSIVPNLAGERLSRLVLGLSACGAAIALCAAGLLAQRWCRVPPRDEDYGGDTPAG